VNSNLNDAESVPRISDSADYQQQTDATLIQQYTAGDLAAFETLYNRHKGGLYRYFKRHISDASAAEDLYQEIWSKVIVQAKHYTPTAKFSTWLYTLAHNKLVDHVRHLTVVNRVVVGSHDEETSEESATSKQAQMNNKQETELSSSRDAEALKQCIGKLPQAQKDSFLLKEEAGLSVKDVSLVLNTSFEASKSRLRYAYDNLRQCLNVKLGRAIL
jgi:RNA polymerase sigma-70 factor (ECF subfamily)